CRRHRIRPLKILVLTPSLPYPPIWGFGTRVYQFLRLLSRNNTVSLLTYEEPGETSKLEAVRQVCQTVSTVPRPAETARSKRTAQAASILSRSSYQRRNLYSTAMQEKLDELASRETFDIIQIESSQLAGFRFDRRATLIVDEHNIEYELLQRMYQTERSAVWREHNWVELT